jgi:CAAX protease family protein
MALICTAAGCGSSSPPLRLNTVLFSLYHFWSPWQNLARIVGLLPWVYVVWRKRSVQLSIAVHVTANTIFLLLLVPAFV